jgi:hypothetical protein
MTNFASAPDCLTAMQGTSSSQTVIEERLDDQEVQSTGVMVVVPLRMQARDLGQPLADSTLCAFG